MWLFVDLCVSTFFWRNLLGLNIKSFSFDVQNNLMFGSDKFSEKWENIEIEQFHVKFWFNRKDIELPCTYKAVKKKL